MKMSESEVHSNATDKSEDAGAKKRRHLIRPAWLRIPLKIIFWLIVVVLLIPVALYIPPVQTGVKNLACGIVKDKTGMDVQIEKLRLKYPLDLSLTGVSVVEASGDTMVNAREVVADVKLLPLLALDVRLRKLQLLDGYYRFVSPDSSMVMTLRAHRLEADDRSSMNIAKSEINLNRACLEGADVSLYMNVWKQKPTPVDSTSTPFLIKINDIEAKNVKFAMSMLPTIDTLTVAAGDMRLRGGVIDLRTNNITARSLSLDGGDFAYITPTPEYIASHPVPVDTVTPPSPPMTIRADSINVDNLKGIYALKGAKPLPGFDANYISVSDVGITMRDFYNRAVELRLPITRLTARERCGLFVTEGRGTVSLDESGIELEGLHILTPWSNIEATAGIPFALMEMKPEAPVNVKAIASIGLPDVEAFMPSLREYLVKLPGRTPLAAKVNIDGRLDNLNVRNFDAAMAGIFSLRASGTARNALTPERLVAQLELDGELISTDVVTAFTGPLGVDVPPLKISGTVGANYNDYTADVDLSTPSGNVVADGHVGLNSEKYEANVSVDHLNVAAFMPDLGVGSVTASLQASGAGFNPLRSGAGTDISLCLDEIYYNNHPLRDLSLQALLRDGHYHVEIDSPNEAVNVEAILDGNIADDDYTVAGDVRLYRLDMKALGLSPDEMTMRADLSMDARLRPERWLYDADMTLNKVEYSSGASEISLPQGITAHLEAKEQNVALTLDGDRVHLNFDSPEGLQSVMTGFMASADTVSSQIGRRYLDMQTLQKVLPPFTLRGGASGSGMLSNLLSSSGLSLDTVHFRLDNDSILRGGASVLAMNSGGLQFDTITLGLKERGSLLDYQLHLGERPGTMDEFANVNLTGYLGSNRLSAYLVQRNLQNETGYRLGFTAAVVDSTVNLHFTPLKARIAYLPWSFNQDNYISYDFSVMRMQANLRASSKESSILMQTQQNDEGKEELYLNIANLKIQDFLNMRMDAPPVKASINSDLRVYYNGKALIGRGTFGVNDLYYDNARVGDLDFTLSAGSNFNDKMGGRLGLKINNKEAMVLLGTLSAGAEGLQPDRMRLQLTEFPLSVANAFLGSDVMQLGGALNGDLKLTGSLDSPMLNGSLACDSVRVHVPMMGSALKLYNDSISVVDNLLTFNDMKIYGANSNPLTISGSVDARKLSDIRLDLAANASNFQLINNDRRAKSEIYGKIFLNLAATAKGPLKHFDVNANLSVLNNTDVYYTLSSAASQYAASSSSDVVKFVNFNDTTQVARADSVAPSMMAMRVNASLNINSGARACVNLSNNGTYKVTLTPSGRLSYYQNYMGDMSLNGQIKLGEGLVRYGFPVLGDKTFNFGPQSYVQFNGNVMNPSFDILATDKIKGGVTTSGGNSRMVNFLVSLSATGTLSAPKVQFDLSTDDDLSLQNELTSMSADQRSMQAMNLLITGRYEGSGMKSSNGNFVTGQLYGFLASTLNSWAAQTIRGVDLSFGIDQYASGSGGATTTATSYSYQVSKSLFNNKFKIVVGGNYTADANADENFAENLLSDVSFEYTLKQTNNLTMLVKLYRHMGFESILEGEVTSTGVGFEMRRRLSTLKSLFKVRWGKKKPAKQDSVPSAEDRAKGLPASEGGDTIKERSDR